MLDRRTTALKKFCSSASVMAVVIGLGLSLLLPSYGKPSSQEESSLRSAPYDEWSLFMEGGHAKRVSAIPRLSQNEWTTILDIEEAGIITHLWFTFPSNDENFGRRNLIRIFWDDNSEPSVVAPLSDFFCLPFGFTGREYRIDSEFLVLAPNNGLNSYFKMPFSKRAQIQVLSE
ncbi:MAG: DUF2961 domain-containing protein, partial [bacterium]